MKVGTKLIIAFLTAILIMASIGVTGILTQMETMQNYKYMYETEVLSMQKINQITQLYQRSRVILRDIILLDDEEEIQAEVENLGEKNAQIDTLFDELVGIMPAENQAKLSEVKDGIDSFGSVAQQAVDIALTKDPKAAYKMLQSPEVQEVTMAAQTYIGELESMVVSDADQMYLADTQRAQQSLIITICILAAGIAVSLLFGMLISRNIKKAVGASVKQLDKMANGAFEALDVNAYTGEFRDMVQNMNHVGTSLERMLHDTDQLAQAAYRGDLSLRADVSQHKGGYARIVEEMNTIIEAVAVPIRETAAQLTRIADGEIVEPMDTDRFSGEFRQMVQNLNDLREALGKMLEDTLKLTQAALGGELSVRADISRHTGGYARIVGGLNGTLDAVVEPVNDARFVLEEMAKGNLGVLVTGDYKGDHAVIKNALNETIDTINGYIGEISGTLDEMAKGNLDVQITSEYKGDFIKLKDSINNIAGSLNDVLGGINTAAEQVASGTAHVSNASQEISQGATEQAGSIEEMTSTVGEIARQTNQNAQSAKQANEISMKAKQSAEQGDEQMKALQQAIQDINESSANIGKIIKVIDEIAFQTNILALNAAVEAARAGVHGKGFAVVAEEVRSLAARSAGAAKETTELIESSIKKTEAGTEIADKTAKALAEIVKSVEEAVTLVSEIAAASNQQATAVNEVNQGIEQMSQVVQTNTATSQEAAATAEELSGQAEMLKKMVDQFKLKIQNDSPPVR